MPDENTALRELAMISRRVMDLLRRHQLDFCCNGDLRLGEACADKEIDLPALLAEIHSAEQEGDRPEDWLERIPVDLIEYLQVRFHEPFRLEMPLLIQRAERVETENVDHEDCPRGLVAQLEIIEKGVETHLRNEEDFFFPILMGEQVGELPIESWRQEHEEHEVKLQRLRVITRDFQPPEDADDEWRELYESFDRLEANLMEHMHLENNILFRMPGLI